MKAYYERFCTSKMGKFILKYHLLYLAIPFILWGFKALLYNIAIWIDPPTRYFHFAIDEQIPFIKYFFVFYFSYYFVPPIFLWILSFYDKKKYKKLIISLLLGIGISFIFFCSFNVVMLREPGYPNDVTLWNVKDLSSFFDFCINWIYNKDPQAMNCFPSLHAMVGMMLVVLGTYIPKVDHSLPIALRIASILIGLGCILSTIFIKQHYFIDMIAGVLLEMITSAGAYLFLYFHERSKKKSIPCNEHKEEV